MPGPDHDAPFLMPVDEVFTIAAQGTVVTGVIERGHVGAGDAVEVVGLGVPLAAVVQSVQAFRKFVPSAAAGDSAALLLAGVGQQQVRRGQVLARPGSLVPCRRFTASLYLLPGTAGGRPAAVRSGYRAQFSIRAVTVGGLIDLRRDGELRPGEAADVAVELDQPVALDAGVAFTISEGGKRHPVTRGSGAVVTLLSLPAPHPRRG
jgi:elongation factor Tu